MQARIIITISWLSVVFTSCTNSAIKEKTDTSLKIDSALSSNGIDSLRKIESNRNILDSLAVSKNVLKHGILGTWALAGTDNAAFVIDKKKITYPETFTSYQYSIEKDSLKIQYDDYVGSFFIKERNVDTLILIGDEEQTYYRFKK